MISSDDHGGATSPGAAELTDGATRNAGDDIKSPILNEASKSAEDGADIYDLEKAAARTVLEKPVVISHSNFSRVVISNDNNNIKSQTASSEEFIKPENGNCKSQDPLTSAKNKGLLTSICPQETTELDSPLSSASDPVNQHYFQELSGVKSDEGRSTNIIAKDTKTPSHQKLSEQQKGSFSTLMKESYPKVLVSPTPSVHTGLTQQNPATDVQMVSLRTSPRNNEKTHCETYAEQSKDISGKYSNFPPPEACPRMVSCSTSANEIVDDKSGKCSVGTSWDKSKNGNGKLFSQVFTGRGFRRASSKVHSDEGSSGENEGNGLSPTASNVSNDDLPREDASVQPLELKLDKITENVPKRASDLNVLNRTSYTPSRGRQVNNLQNAENEVGSAAPKRRTAGRPKKERTGNRQQQLEQDQQSLRLRPRRSSKRPERFVAVPSKRGFSADEGDLLFLLSGDHAGKNTEFTRVEVKGESDREKCHTDIKREVAESRPAMTLRSHGNAIKRNEQQRPVPIPQTFRRRTRRSSKTPERYVARPSKQGLGADEGDMLFMITGNLSTSRNGRHDTQHGGDQEVRDKDFNIKKESTEEGVTKRSSNQQTGQSDDEAAALLLPRSTLATVPQLPTTILVKKEHRSDTSICTSKPRRNQTPPNDVTSNSPLFAVTTSDAIMDDTDADVQRASYDDPADSNQGRKTRHSVSVKTEKDDSYNLIGPDIIKQEYDKSSCSINCKNAMSSQSAQPPRARVTVGGNQVPIARSTRQSLRMRKFKSDNAANGHSNERRTNAKLLTCGNAGKTTASKVTKPPFTEIKKSSEDEVIFLGKTESLARRTRSMSRCSNKPTDSCGDKPGQTSGDEEVVLAQFDENEHASVLFSNNGSVKSENPRVKRGPFLNSTHVSFTTSPRKRMRRTTPSASSQQSDNHSTLSTTTSPVRRSLRLPILSQKALALSTISLDTNRSARLTDISAHKEKNGENAIIVAITSGHEHDTPLSKTPSASDTVSPVKKRGRPPKRSTERSFIPHQASTSSQEHTSDSEVHSVRRTLRHPTPTPKVLASQSPIDEGIPPNPKISSKTSVKKRGRPRKIRPDENNSEIVDLTGTCSPQCTQKSFHDLRSSSEKTNETKTKSTLLSPKSSRGITEGCFVIVHRRTSPDCNKQGVSAICDTC